MVAVVALMVERIGGFNVTCGMIIPHTKSRKAPVDLSARFNRQHQHDNFAVVKFQENTPASDTGGSHIGVHQRLR